MHEYIQYIYDALGTKLRKMVSSGVTTNYAGNYIYEGSSLKFFSQSEGYVEPDGSGGYEYLYQHKDHLGNIRLSYKNVGSTSTPSLQIQEENNYYPFGLKHKGYNGVVNSTNIALKKMFGGKEYQDELNLDWYDYGARNYDAALGRWMNIDPLAENYSNISPYVYVANSPLMITDPNGKELYLDGTRKERRKQFREAKKLTNDRLRLNRKTGEVTIAKKGVRNKSKNLKLGTSTISNIIGSKNKVSVVSKSKFQKDFNSSLDGNRTIDPQMVKDKTGNYSENATNGTGISEAVVVFDMADLGKGIQNADGTTGRPIRIGLGHELLHADRLISGTVVDNDDYMDFIDPDNRKSGVGGAFMRFNSEEIEVRYLDNVLRAEQKVKLRAETEYVPPKDD